MEKSSGAILTETWRDGSHINGVSAHTFGHSRRSLRNRIQDKYFSSQSPSLILSPLHYPSSKSSSSESLNSSSSSAPSYSGPSLSSRSSISGYATLYSDEGGSGNDYDIEWPDHHSFPHLKHASTASTGGVESSPVSSNLGDVDSDAIMRVSADDSMAREEPSRHVDYLSHDWNAEDLWATWSHIVSQRKVYGEISRLENAVWRTWAQSMNALQTCPAYRINWLKESDVTWLYGPLKAGRYSKPSAGVDKPSLSVHVNDSPKKEPLMRKGILKKRTVAATMLQCPPSFSSLDKEATASPPRLVRPAVNFLLADDDEDDDYVGEASTWSFESSKLQRASVYNLDNSEPTESVRWTEDGPDTARLREVRALADNLYTQCRDSPSSYKLLTGPVRKLRNILEEAEEIFYETRSLIPDHLRPRLLEKVQKSGNILHQVDLALHSNVDIEEGIIADLKTLLDVNYHELKIAFDALSTGEIELHLDTNILPYGMPLLQGDERPPSSAATATLFNTKFHSDKESSVVGGQPPLSELARSGPWESVVSSPESVKRPFKVTSQKNGDTTVRDKYSSSQAAEIDDVPIVQSKSLQSDGSSRDARRNPLLNHESNKLSARKSSTRKACARCRARRVKCDGNNPCSSCSRTGEDCYGNDSPKKVLHSETYLRELQRRSKALETPLSELSQTNVAKGTSSGSCARCRLRKTRCDGRDPCSSCLRVGVNCRKRDISRKFYVPQAYVEELEQRVKQTKSQDSQPIVEDLEKEKPPKRQNAQPVLDDSAFLKFDFDDNKSDLYFPAMQETNDTDSTEDFKLWEESFITVYLGANRLQTYDLHPDLNAETVQRRRSGFRPTGLRSDLKLTVPAMNTFEKHKTHKRYEMRRLLSLRHWKSESDSYLLVFAIVTCLFLPLSFLTSYFGMDLEHVRTDEATWSYSTCTIGIGGLLGAGSILPLLRKGRSRFKITFPRLSIPGVLSVQIWLHNTMPMPLLRLLRPNVRHGRQRLEWKCTCGRAMYGDYAKHDTMQNASLSQYLPECRIVDATADAPRTLSNVPARTEEILKPRSRKNIVHGLLTWKLPLMKVLNREVGSGDSSQDSMEHRTTQNDTSDTSSAPPGSHRDAQSAPSSRNLSMSNMSNSSNGTASESVGKISERSSSRSVFEAKLCDAMPAFFELCVNGSKTRVSLGEIAIRDVQGRFCINTDMQLFKTINEEYNRLRRKGLYTWLYRPNNIHFVRFGVHRGGFQTGIYEKPLAVPPAEEVNEQRYHYYECPLDPLPPIDPGTFFHYFWDHASHPESSGHPGFDTLFFNRLPKKLGDSILKQADPGKLQLGWGVHIIEGPNKPLLAWLATGILVLSFITSLVYDVVLKNRESGFAIGQWIVAVLGTALTAMYFHLADLV